MTWALPPRRSQFSIGLAADFEAFKKYISVQLDWAYEQLAKIFVGVPVVNQRGQVTISGASTSGDFVFTTAEVDTVYSVHATAVALTGAPATGAFTVQSVTKATSKATLNLVAAPGVGTSVTFDVIVTRELTR